MLDNPGLRIRLLKLMATNLKERLLIKLAQIPKDGLEIKEKLPREWLINIPEFSDDDGAHLEGNIEIHGKLRMEGDSLRLRGGLQARLATICTRCGDPVIHPLAGELEIVLMKGRAPDPVNDLELSDEDMNRDYYDGNEVDLAPFFREELALRVPVQTLCKDDCAGLCTVCGVNLNAKKCGCQKGEGDPRLAVLRNLKIE